MFRTASRGFQARRECLSDKLGLRRFVIEISERIGACTKRAGIQQIARLCVPAWQRWHQGVASGFL
jgi:hypothetical protein